MLQGTCLLTVCHDQGLKGGAQSGSTPLRTAVMLQDTGLLTAQRQGGCCTSGSAKNRCL